MPNRRQPLLMVESGCSRTNYIFLSGIISINWFYSSLYSSLHVLLSFWFLIQSVTSDFPGEQMLDGLTPPSEKLVKFNGGMEAMTCPLCFITKLLLPAETLGWVKAHQTIHTLRRANSSSVWVYTQTRKTCRLLWTTLEKPINAFIKFKLWLCMLGNAL